VRARNLWIANKKVGPLVISTGHPGTRQGGKPFRVFFTHVAVKLAASADWIPAQ
jgi:hypothetical protein